MNGINPIQVNPVNIAQAPPQAQQRPTVDAVRTLTVQIRRQTAELIPLANNFYTAWMVLPQARALSSSALQQLKNTFLEADEGHADFLRKLENCTDEVRHNAREVTRLAISLHNNSFEALEIASHLLERGPGNLLVTTPLGPWSLSKQAIDTSLLYHITGDAEVLQGQQPQDRANLAALHAEWAQDDAIDPYALQRQFTEYRP
ncbi:MAG: hypothetical protein ACLGGW_08380 [Gammaproteobacteria bacterium]